MRRRVKGACAPYGYSGPKKDNSVLRRQVSISKRAGAARKRLAIRNQSLTTSTFVVDSTDGDMDMGDEETESDVPDIVHTAPMSCPAVLSAQFPSVLSPQSQVPAQEGQITSATSAHTTVVV